MLIAEIDYWIHKFANASLMMFIRVWTIVLAPLVCHPCVGQPASFADELQAKLDRYYSEHVPLNIDAQFSQPSYAPGDTAWFSLWLTTERGGLPIEGRQIIHADLLTRSGNVIQPGRVLATDGRGEGQLVLPQSMEPGIYVVVFSTGWTNNDNDPVCGFKELVISGDHVFTTGIMSLNFYIEGGTLVQSVPNEILVTGRPGATVALLEGEKVVERLVLDRLGYGHLTLIPEASSKYRIRDERTKVELPAPIEGVAMTLSLHDTTSIAALSLRSATAGNSCRLVLTARGKLAYSAMLTFQNRIETISVPRRSLPAGLILATVFNEQNQPIAERIFVANRPQSSINVTPQHSTVHPRQRIPIAIAATDFTSPLTVSVYAADAFSSGQQRLENAAVSVARLPVAALNFHLDSAWTLNEWNRFLITQQWQRFSWTDVFAGTHRTHHAEKYLRIKGRIQLPKSATFDSVRVTFFLRNDARVYEEYVDKTGAFDLELFFDFYDVEEVVFVVDRKGVVIPDATLALNPERIPQVRLTAFSSSAHTDPYPSFVGFQKSIAEAYARYDSLTLVNDVFNPNASIEEELSSADITVRLDEYLLFPTMEETLREVVPKLQHRWKEKRHSVTVALTDPDGLATGDPMYFIDGVVTDNTDYFMGLKPEDVSTISIVSIRRKLSTMGILGANGIVLVTTKIPNNHLNVPRAGRSFEVTGLIHPKQFNNYLSQPSRTPLLRSTAYFDSNVKLNGQDKATFELLVPDNTGLLRVEVTGMTKSGTLTKAVTYLRSIRPTSTP